MLCLCNAGKAKDIRCQREAIMKKAVLEVYALAVCFFSVILIVVVTLVINMKNMNQTRAMPQNTKIRN